MTYQHIPRTTLLFTRSKPVGTPGDSDQGVPLQNHGRGFGVTLNWCGTEKLYVKERGQNGTNSFN